MTTAAERLRVALDYVDQGIATSDETRLDLDDVRALLSERNALAVMLDVVTRNFADLERRIAAVDPLLAAVEREHMGMPPQALGLAEDIRGALRGEA